MIRAYTVNGLYTSFVLFVMRMFRVMFLVTALRGLKEFVMNLVEKEVNVRVRDEKTGQWNGRMATKTVLTLDLDYGRHRKERQERERKLRIDWWHNLDPWQQLEDLDLRVGVGVGATKQRARIKAEIERIEQERAERLAKMQAQKEHMQKQREKVERNRQNRR